MNNGDDTDLLDIFRRYISIAHRQNGSTAEVIGVDVFSEVVLVIHPYAHDPALWVVPPSGSNESQGLS